MVEESDVVRLVARGMYLADCQFHGSTPYRDPYVPPWAVDHAVVAVRMLGYPDDVTRGELERLMVPDQAVVA